MIDNLEKIKAELAGRNVRIVPATKTVSPEVINELPQYGIREAGENRVQELLQKYEAVRGVDWHFIGRLQTNKVKYIVDKVVMIQSLDREELADEIEKRCDAINKVMECLIEVNVGGEQSKGGVAPPDLWRLIDYAAQKKHIRVRGLMSVLPIGADEELYEDMNALFGKVKSYLPGADILSVGMSEDYLIAARHGANMIRPGSMLFGARARV